MYIHFGFRFRLKIANSNSSMLNAEHWMFHYFNWIYLFKLGRFVGFDLLNPVGWLMQFIYYNIEYFKELLLISAISFQHYCINIDVRTRNKKYWNHCDDQVFNFNVRLKDRTHLFIAYECNFQLDFSMKSNKWVGLLKHLNFIISGASSFIYDNW